MNDSRILVTGLGNVCAAGIGLHETAAALGEPGTLVPGQFADVHDFDIVDYVQTKQSYLDRNTALGMAAVALALQDAGLTVDDANAPNTGIAAGTALGNPQTAEAFMKTLFEKGGKFVSPFLFTHAYPNTTASMVAIEFSLMGAMINYYGDASAALAAVASAADTLRQNGAACIVTLGVDASGALDRLAFERPADAAPPLAEGAAAVMLERADSAESRGAAAHAELVAEAMLSFEPSDANAVTGAIQRIADGLLDSAGCAGAGIVLVSGDPLWDFSLSHSLSIKGIDGPAIAIDEHAGRALAASGALAFVLAAALVSQRPEACADELSRHLAGGRRVETAMAITLDSAGTAAGAMLAKV